MLLLILIPPLPDLCLHMVNPASIQSLLVYKVIVVLPFLLLLPRLFAQHCVSAQKIECITEGRVFVMVFILFYFEPYFIQIPQDPRCSSSIFSAVITNQNLKQVCFCGDTYSVLLDVFTQE